ncbi:MAG: biotin/lipoyl-binding protein [Pseudomonadota bacterium]
MQESGSDKKVPKTKACGVLLAAVVAVASLVIVALTHSPKSAVSSPPPAKAAIVPQIADAKSEADIILRGKSFALFKRDVTAWYAGQVSQVLVEEGQIVEKDQVLAEYEMDRPTMVQINTMLYPSTVLTYDRQVQDQETTIDQTVKYTIPTKKLQVDQTKKEVEDTRILVSKGMATQDALDKAESRLESLQQDMGVTDSRLGQLNQQLAKYKKDLEFQRGNEDRNMSLLEWRTKRPYRDTDVPINKAFLKAPFHGRIFWIDPLFRVGSEIPAGCKAIIVAPLHGVVVRCKVHELEMVKLKQGDRGTVEFDALKSLEDKNKNKKYQCRVARIPWISRNPDVLVPADYDVEFALDDVDGAVREGMSCEVRITVTN